MKNNKISGSVYIRDKGWGLYQTLDSKYKNNKELTVLNILMEETLLYQFISYKIGKSNYSLVISLIYIVLITWAYNFLFYFLYPTTCSESILMQVLHSFKIFDIEFLPDLYALSFPEIKKVVFKNWSVRMCVYAGVNICTGNIQCFIFPKTIKIETLHFINNTR